MAFFFLACCQANSKTGTLCRKGSNARGEKAGFNVTVSSCCSSCLCAVLLFVPLQLLDEYKHENSSASNSRDIWCVSEQHPGVLSASYSLLQYSTQHWFSLKLLEDLWRWDPLSAQVAGIAFPLVWADSQLLRSKPSSNKYLHKFKKTIRLEISIWLVAD